VGKPNDTHTKRWWCKSRWAEGVCGARRLQDKPRPKPFEKKKRTKGGLHDPWEGGALSGLKGGGPGHPQVKRW